MLANARKIYEIVEKHYSEYPVLPSIVIAYAYIETNLGDTKLSKIANNYFNIPSTMAEKIYVVSRRYFINRPIDDFAISIYDSLESCVIEYCEQLLYIIMDTTYDIHKMNENGYYEYKKFFDNFHVLETVIKYYQLELFDDELFDRIGE